MKEPYFLEKALPSRVKKYMSETKTVDMEDMTDYLINTYKEYRIKKKKIFIKSVIKAYKWELYKNRESREIESVHLDDIIEIDTNGDGSSRMQNSSFTIDTLYRSSPTRNRVRKSYKSQNEKEDILSVKNVKKKRKFVDSGEVQVTSLVKRKKLEFYTPDTSLKEMKGITSLYDRAFLLAMSLFKDNLDADAPKRALLIGPEGSGKTMFATCLAGEVRATLLRVSVLEFGSGGLETETTVKEAFKQARSLAPSILLLENLDHLSSKEYTINKGPEKKICDQIQSSLTELETKYLEKRVLVIAEARSPQGIHVDLRNKFKTDIFMPPLDRESRIDILRLFCSKMKPDFDFGEIALRTSSFVAGDLKDLTQKAKHMAWKRTVEENLGKDVFTRPEIFFTNFRKFAKGRSLEIILPDFMAALPMVIPTLKREGFPVIPDTTWEDVGGLDDIKSELREKILEPMQYGKLHEQFRAKQPNGIILWGPPGCGKTLLAKAVANHAGVNLYAVMGPELLNMYQGESERAIREVFKRASAVAPCVIFFDEFDCICPRRVAGSDSGSKTTIVNTLLVEMNGFSRRKDVYVMAATNRPDMVDTAVLRPERFDTSLYIGLPDQKGRVAVFRACTKNGTEPRLASDVDLEEISSRCANFSGADCAHLVYTASKSAITEKLGEGQTSIEEEVGTLCKRHFEVALKRVLPSVNLEEQKKYLRMKTLFENYKAQSSKAPEMKTSRDYSEPGGGVQS